MNTPIRTLLVDNYDSFTNNLFQYIAHINKLEPIIIKNDECSIDEILNFEFDNIVISPGPGRADLVADFGVCGELIKKAEEVPILGVCLGHQGIGSVFGAEIIHAPYPVHGQAYTVKHNNNVLFKDIPNEFEVIRYHSLVVNNETLPESLEVIAYTENNLIMGLKHKQKPIWGVQFHPESINTKFGYKLLENFMQTTKPKKTYYINNNKLEKTNNNKEGAKKYCFQYKKIDELYADDKVCEYLYKSVKDLVWLDSNHDQSNASRFSIVACLDGPHSYKVLYDVNSQIISYKKDEHSTYLSMTIFDFIKLQLEKMDIPDADLPFNFRCGFVGYFGYELYKDTLNISLNKTAEHPDAQFLFVDRAIVFDKVAKATYLLALYNEDTEQEVLLWFKYITKLLESTKNTKMKYAAYVKDDKIGVDNFYLHKDKSSYIQDINTCLDYIKNGESYEICLTNKAIYQQQVDPFNYYLSLRKLSKAPFSAFLKFRSLAICSSSMERFLEIDKSRNVQTKPIKGTLPRGKSIDEDKILIEKLRNEKKYKSENLMIVDLLRHDLGGVCEIGSVRVDKLMDVESYASVHQLVSTICGKLRKDLSPLDCIKAAFPGGSMVGAPKNRTIKLIGGLEKEARGIYSGAIGYISADGCVDLNIVIRTAVITPEKVSIGIGGAIIALSDPEEEFEETMLKLDLLKKALNQVA